jgi:hypothetical protein
LRELPDLRAPATGRSRALVNPKQLRDHLQLIAEDVPLAPAPSWLHTTSRTALFIHLDSHVAAMMDDRPPLGVIDAGDLIAHQLEGPPELIELGELLRARGRTSFDVLRVPAGRTSRGRLIGGDVMLGRTVGKRILDGGDPFFGIRELLRPPGSKDRESGMRRLR